jgi:hypothetical protein
VALLGLGYFLFGRGGDSDPTAPAASATSSAAATVTPSAGASAIPSASASADAVQDAGVEDAGDDDVPDAAASAPAAPPKRKYKWPPRRRPTEREDIYE